MNAKAFCYRFEGRKGIVERWVEMRITWKSAFCPRKPLNPKLIHVQKRPPRRLEGVHGPWFAQGVSGSSIVPTWGLYFNTFQQLAFRWGEWKIKFVSPVLGIDGKNPKSRAVASWLQIQLWTGTCFIHGPNSKNHCGPDLGRSKWVVPNTGDWDTLINCRFQEKMLIKQTLYFGVPYLFWERPESCDFHNCVQSPFHLLQRSGSGTRSWPKGAGNMSDWAVSCVCFPFTFFSHISTSKSINWIPGLVSRLHACGTMLPDKIAW